MNKKETMEFLKRIKSHYQEFVIDDFKAKEWHSELEKYDAADVNIKFEEHLKSEIYGEQIPKLFFLTKYLIPTSEKGKVIHNIVSCPSCNKLMLDRDLESHSQRCLESNSIVRDMKKYFGIEVDKNQLMQMHDDDFEKAYQRYLNKMLDSSCPGFQKKIIIRILHPEYSDLDINEVVDAMVAK